ncbi:MAG: polysialyltransferase family glycosyltransferase [Desulfopila sp.]
MRIIACQTPLHFLVASFILEKSTRDNILFWIEESNISEDFVSVLWGNCCRKIIKVPGAGKIEGKFDRTIQKFRNVRQIKKNINEIKARCNSKITELYIFNDNSPETQCLMHCAARDGGKIYLGEDGVAIYDIGGLFRVNLANKWIGKLIYGLWWDPQKRMGLSRKISIIYAFYPNCVRRDILDFKKILAIPELNYDNYKNIINSLRLPLIDITDAIVWVVPLSTETKSEKINCFLEELILSEGKAILKFHPRENERFIQNLKIRLQDKIFYEFPKELPVEILFLQKSQAVKIIGCGSSALHIVKKINENVQVFHLNYNNEDSAIDNWREFYETIGVKCFYVKENCS